MEETRVFVGKGSIPHPDIKNVLYTPEQIQQRLAVLGKHLSNLYRDKSPLYVCVLKGAFVFLADLVRFVDGQVEVDFVAVSSYGDQDRSSGVVRMVKDLSISVEGRDVILVEDIIDSGRTLDYLLDLLRGRRVSSLRVVSLLVRLDCRGIEIPSEDYGFLLTEDSGFVVGYGLDYAGRYRNLPYIGNLKPGVIR
ncbi:hypoxanthine phosphoribosyltransferase [Pasteuria penetrans]|uniref:hypoxanthine phosphoribosyltransferase n=1 Tax=Pasteuria penetrans TaxID=86005 RepID=UPI000FAC7B79|nr:hypoxanthine phosphoribosyltransferase [Pasteuria penetrans]